MLFNFKKQSYSYTPAYEIKTKNKLNSLTIKYQNIFLRYIAKDTFSQNDNELLLEAIKEVSQYIYQGVLYQIHAKFDSKTSAEKKLETLFSMLIDHCFKINIDFKSYIQEEFTMLAEDSIYEAIGFKNSTKQFTMTSETSNFIKYTKAIMFFKVISFLEKKINPIKEDVTGSEALEYNEEDNITEEDIDAVFKSKKFDKCLPSDILIELKHAILTREFPEHIRPYLARLAKD